MLICFRIIFKIDLKSSINRKSSMFFGSAFLTTRIVYHFYCTKLSQQINPVISEDIQFPVTIFYSSTSERQHILSNSRKQMHSTPCFVFLFLNCSFYMVCLHTYIKHNFATTQHQKRGNIHRYFPCTLVLICCNLFESQREKI